MCMRVQGMSVLGQGCVLIGGALAADNLYTP